MQPKELANVLVKLMGLSTLLMSIPEILRGLLALARNGRFNPGELLVSLIFVAVGFYLIVKSRKVVELLFKGDRE